MDLPEGQRMPNSMQCARDIVIGKIKATQQRLAFRGVNVSFNCAMCLNGIYDVDKLRKKILEFDMFDYYKSKHIQPDNFKNF